MIESIGLNRFSWQDIHNVDVGMGLHVNVSGGLPDIFFPILRPVTAHLHVRGGFRGIGYLVVDSGDLNYTPLSDGVYSYDMPRLYYKSISQMCKTKS